MLLVKLSLHVTYDAFFDSIGEDGESTRDLPLLGLG